MKMPTLQKKTFLILAAVCVLTMVASPLRMAIMALLTLHALRGPRQIIEAFTVGMFLLFLNPALFGSLSAASTLRWPLIFGAFARVVWDLTRHRQAIWTQAAIPLLIAFSLCAVLFAPMTSYYPQISIMKGISFFVGTFTILTAFRLTANLHEYWLGWFATFFVFFVWASIPFLWLPGGYIGGMFKGIVNHSQAFGTFLVPFTGWLTVVLIRSERRPVFLALTVLLGWFFIYISGSRTSFLATGLAITLTLGLSLLHADWRKPVLLGLRRLMLPVLLAVVVVGALAGPQIVSSLKAFALKGDQVESYDEAFQNSRGFFIQQQMANFRQSPLIGIGFGVPSVSDKLRIKQSGFLGLPSGASVEKGFLPSAVLEEMGLIGGFLVICIILSLLLGAWRQPDPALFALLVAGLLINVGEMIFFSPAAGGMFMWLCFGLAAMPYSDTETSRYAHRVVYRKPSPALGRLENAV